jgi:non-canonical purine NTP pyrophosphatase (RdgB/HAM1 family)
MTHRRLGRGRLVLASHNAGKLREVAALLAPHGLQVVSVKELGLPEPEESAGTFLGNAGIKALAAARATGLPALADDSGFSVAALDGDPGVRTADWAMRPDGGRDYAMAMGTVAERSGGAAAADRRAWFTCALVLAWPDGHTEASRARCTANGCGRRGETRASATTRCSRRRAAPKPSARWTPARSTASTTGHGPSRCWPGTACRHRTDAVPCSRAPRGAAEPVPTILLSPAPREPAGRVPPGHAAQRAAARPETGPRQGDEKRHAATDRAALWVDLDV